MPERDTVCQRPEDLMVSKESLFLMCVTPYNNTLDIRPGPTCIRCALGHAQDPSQIFPKPSYIFIIFIWARRFSMSLTKLSQKKKKQLDICFSMYYKY